MSLILNKLQLARSILQSILIPEVISGKFIHSTRVKFDTKEENVEETVKARIDPSKDRRTVIPVDVSIKYLQSSAYKKTYGDDPVWKRYRRNFKGQFQPRKTRRTCIRNGIISTGSPCPICRDEYLVLDYRNIDLLKQFISEHSGEILDYNYTGLCQKTYKDLLVAIMQAKDCGLLIYDVPFLYYNYMDWK